MSCTTKNPKKKKRTRNGRRFTVPTKMSFARIAAMFVGATAFGAGAGSVGFTGGRTPSAAPFPFLGARQPTDGASPFALTTVHAGVFDRRHGNAFTPKFEPFTLGEVLNIAEDVAIFRFLMPNPDDEFSLASCSTLQAQARQGLSPIDRVQRAYTPITPNGTKGYFDLLVKRQRKGRMTEVLFSMKPGDKMDFRLMSPKIEYLANRYHTIGCIAGGTGLAPVYQVIQSVLEDASDKTKLSLLFANQTDRKILMRTQLDDMHAKHPDRFSLFYTVDRAESPGWTGFTGHVDKAMIQKTMPKPKSNSLILVCGPDAMVHSLAGVPFAVLKQMSGGLPQQPVGAHLTNHQELSGVLAACGYSNDEVYRF